MGDCDYQAIVKPAICMVLDWQDQQNIVATVICGVPNAYLLVE
jgi:hypothetical protein